MIVSALDTFARIAAPPALANASATRDCFSSARPRINTRLGNIDRVVAADKW